MAPTIVVQARLSPLNPRKQGFWCSGNPVYNQAYICEAMLRRIAVIGGGRVGLVTAACLAHFGNEVVCIEHSPFFLEMLCAERIPFYEPGLCELVTESLRARTLSFSKSIEEGIPGASLIFLAVGTPQKPDGASDLTDILTAADEIGRFIKSDICIVSKSTVPPGTNEQILSRVQEIAPAGVQVTIASNPEFLREGSAVADFLEPDRIIIGVQREEDAAVLADLYAHVEAPIIVTDLRTAELIKSVSNFYLALRVSFANQVADVCDALQVDVLNVLHAVGMDSRIGHGYLQPGLGFGGPCLPKDLRGLADSATRAGAETPLMSAALLINDTRISRAVSILSNALGELQARRICVLGLSFKPGTDDLRGAPSLKFIEALIDRGAIVHAHDPMALDTFRHLALSSRVRCKAHIDDAVRGADAVAIITAWPQYKELSLAAIAAAMRGDVLFDAANIFEPAQVTDAGLTYRGIGRTGPVFADEATKADVSA